jgi:hypothetical protein
MSCGKRLRDGTEAMPKDEVPVVLPPLVAGGTRDERHQATSATASTSNFCPSVTRSGAIPLV